MTDGGGTFDSSSISIAAEDDNDAMFAVSNNTNASIPQYKENNFSNAVRVGDTWVRNCSSPFDNIDFENPRIVGSLVPLGIVCLIGRVSSLCCPL